MSAHAQLPSPFGSPVDESRPLNDQHPLGFPIFHHDYAAKSPGQDFFSMSNAARRFPSQSLPRMRPGQAATALQMSPVIHARSRNDFLPGSHLPDFQQNHLASPAYLSSDSYGSHHQRLQFESNNALQHFGTSGLSELDASVSDLSLDPRALSLEIPSMERKLPTLGFDFGGPQNADLSPPLSASSFSQKGVQLEAYRHSRKKQSVDPLIYKFTTESSFVTDPIKFDKAVIAFLKSKGKPVIKMPSVDKKWLSFWSLYHAVHEFGGSDAVTKSRKWKQVAHKLLLPTTLTSASYTLRTFYTKYLLEFEQFYDCHPNKGALNIYKSAEALQMDQTMRSCDDLGFSRFLDGDMLCVDLS